MARRVLEEQPGRVGPLPKARVKFPQRGHQAVGLCAHVRLVVDDHAGQASCEVAGELLDHTAVAFAQHVQTAVQVDRGQTAVRRHIFEHMVKLIRGVRVRLSGEACLGEAEPGKPEQRRVAGYPLLEERVHRLGA